MGVQRADAARGAFTVQRPRYHAPRYHAPRYHAPRYHAPRYHAPRSPARSIWT